MKTKTLAAILIVVLVMMAAASRLSATVRVYGEASSTGPAISVQIYADITGPEVVSHTFKLFYPAAQLSVTSASRNTAIWYLYDGTKTLPYAEPNTTVAGEVLFVGGHMDARTPGVGVTGGRVLLGSVSLARRSALTPAFGLSIGRTGQFASFVTTAAVVLEAEPGLVTFEAITPSPLDADLDGLTDKWEIRYFGSTKAAYYSDDPDRDGANNLDELLMGSDPTDGKSNLHLTVTETPETIVLEWPSVAGRTYTIEGSGNLLRFKTLKTGILATPSLNRFEFQHSDLPDIYYFRLRVELAPN